LAEAIKNTTFNEPQCAVYQNVVARGVTSATEIQENLVAQLTAPVRWTQTMNQMVADDLTEVIEVGPGKVLQGLFKKVDRALPCSSAEFFSC
jgi:[acyl-carrier-protein] S-malonyltransferase